jgi:antibiotic biosynthesis monooxygenase (ABM) superfamily enzyme
MPTKYRTRQRPPRNTAPLWKKLAIVLSTVVVLVVVLNVSNAPKMGFLPLLGIVLVVVVGMVWLMSRLLGVRIGLRSWD